MSEATLVQTLKEVITDRAAMESFIADLDDKIDPGGEDFELAMGLMALAKFDGDAYQAAFFVGLDVHRVQAWKARLVEGGVDYEEWSDAVCFWADCGVASGLLERSRGDRGQPMWKVGPEGIKRVEAGFKKREGV